MPSRTSTKKRMTQSEIINYFVEKTGLSRSEVKNIFDELAHLASIEVKANDEFQLPGFGKLVRSERKAREGRNPATGEAIQIGAKTTLKFRIGKSVKEMALGGDNTRDSDIGGESGFSPADSPFDSI